MFKKLFIFLLFLIEILIVILLVFNFTKIKKSSETTFKKNLQPTMSIVKDKMFFIYELESIDQRNKIISIKFGGPKNIKADAADLQLDFDNNIKIEKIIDGNSFSSYPRKIIKDNYLLVTGVALDQNNKFVFAQPETTFIQIKLKIINPNQKTTIRFNPQESKIFFSGTDVTDLTGSFSEIIF